MLSEKDSLHKDISKYGKENAFNSRFYEYINLRIIFDSM